jgi:hypothetical protein
MNHLELTDLHALSGLINYAAAVAAADCWGAGPLEFFVTPYGLRKSGSLPISSLTCSYSLGPRFPNI